MYMYNLPCALTSDKISTHGKVVEEVEVVVEDKREKSFLTVDIFCPSHIITVCTFHVRPSRTALYFLAFNLLLLFGLLLFIVFILTELLLSS